MVFPFAAAASVAAPIIGGLFGSSSAKSQNKAAARAAQTQMDFQREMSNTAHQREVQDLKLAGLNPILSAGGSGASSPSGSSYTPVSEAAGISEGISSALQQRLIQAQIDQVKSQTALNRSQQGSVDANAAVPKVVEKIVNTGISSAARVKDVPSAAKDIFDYFSEGGDIRSLAIEAGLLDEPLSSSAKSLPMPSPPRPSKFSEFLYQAKQGLARFLSRR